MPAQWKIVGSSKFTKEERDVSAFRLDGDVSTLLVPLRWPISKVLEENLVLATAERIRPFWQTLIAQSEEPETPGYVPFPEGDDLHEVYAKADGERFDPWPWDDQDASETARGVAPTNWQALFARWYREQHWYREPDLVDAFGKALEVLTGIPLERAAPLLHFSTLNAATGGDVSESKPASTSTKKKTERRSGPPPITSSPAA